MTREEVDKIFNGDLGQQVDVLFSTSDNRCFIRKEEAIKHTEGTLDDTEPLEDKSIADWYPT